MEYYDDMSKKIRVLIISYYYPPSKSVGAVRIGSLYSFLTHKGYEVDIMCFDDNSISTSSKLDKNKVNKNATKKLKLSQYFRSIDKSIFSKFLIFNFKKIFISKNNYDVVICSYKPISNIILGILLKLRRKRTKLFIEFRDLISQFGRKKRVLFFHKLDELIDKFYVFFADELISVSPSSRTKAENFYNRKVHLIYNGFDFRKNYYKKPTEKIKILYAGTLSSVRNLKLITNHILKSKLNIELIIASNENPAKFNGDFSFVNYIGFVSREDLENRIKEVNFLLILEGFDRDSEENIPAKLFEYLSYNKPIMANCSLRSEIINILNETNSGMNINEYENFEKLLKMDNFKVNENIEFYSRENQFNKYKNLINENLKK